MGRTVGDAGPYKEDGQLQIAPTEGYSWGGDSILAKAVRLRSGRIISAPTRGIRTLCRAGEREHTGCSPTEMYS